MITLLSQSELYSRCQSLPTWLPWQKRRSFSYLTWHRWQLVISTERSTQLIQFVQEREKCEALGISAKSCQKQNSTFSSRCNKTWIAASKHWKHWCLIGSYCLTVKWRLYRLVMPYTVVVTIYWKQAILTNLTIRLLVSMLIGILLTLNEKSRVLKINMCNLKNTIEEIHPRFLHHHSDSW